MRLAVEEPYDPSRRGPLRPMVAPLARQLTHQTPSRPGRPAPVVFQYPPPHLASRGSKRSGPPRP